MDSINDAVCRPPKEISLPPPERKDNTAPEIQPPPPEFGAAVTKKEDKQNKRRFLKRIITIPLIALFGYLIFAGQSFPPTDPSVPSSSQDTQTDTTEVSDTDATQPDETEPTTEKEYAAPFPLEDRNMLVTVYAGHLDESYEIQMLLQEEVSELGFESMDLPICPPLDGYTFSGYVIHTGNPVHPEEEPPNTSKAVIPLTDQLLTKSDVEKTPFSTDGKRYVNIYPVWIPSRAQTSEDVTFVLDDGQGNRTTYIDDSPMYSEGFHYIVAYPETKRPGYVFGGWFTSDGKRVDALQSFMDFYAPTVYDDYGNVIDCDWSQPLNNIVLTARWYPEE